MSSSHTHSFYRELPDGREQQVTVEYDASPYYPAQTYGPPENCYPAEGVEVEITDAWLEPQGFKVNLPDDEREKYELWLMENPQHDDYDDYDEYDNWRGDD